MGWMGTWGWYAFLKTPPGILSLLPIPLEILKKASFHPWEILQKCVKPVGNSKVRNQDPWKFHISFFLTLQEMSTCFSFNTPWKFHGLKPPVFFWNSNSPAIMFVRYRYTLLKKIALCVFCEDQAEMPWKCLLRKQSLLYATIRRN